MNRTRLVRLLRYLRIAFSAVCGMACVLLVVLWVRSYFRYDTIGRSSRTGSVQIASSHGVVFIYVAFPPGPPLPLETRWYSSSLPQPGIGFIEDTATASDTTLHLPYWVLVGLSGVVTGLTSIVQLYRFSLRTLLIAATLVAVVLGLIVWAEH